MDTQSQIDELRTRMSILERMVLLMSQSDVNENQKVNSKPKKPKKQNPFRQRNIV
jgi:hypothetical protein